MNDFQSMEMQCGKDSTFYGSAALITATALFWISYNANHLVHHYNIYRSNEAEIHTAVDAGSKSIERRIQHVSHFRPQPIFGLAIFEAQASRVSTIISPPSASCPYL